MSKSESWEPRELLGVIRDFKTSARTCLVLTDAGQGYIKTMLRDEESTNLACELVGTNAAEWMELKTLDYSILNLNHSDISLFPDPEGRIAGPAFITKAVNAIPWNGTPEGISKNALVNPEDVNKLIVFDTWTLNCDRYLLNSKSDKPRRNLGNVLLAPSGKANKLSLVAMDHTHCFTCGSEFHRRKFGINAQQDDRIFGNFPEFKKNVKTSCIKEASNRLSQVSKSEIEVMMKDMPKDWMPQEIKMSEWVDFMALRAAFVSSTIEGKIVERLKTRTLVDQTEDAE